MFTRGYFILIASMNPFGSMIFPTLNQLIHRAEAFLPSKKISHYHCCYPIHSIIRIPRIINPNIIYIYMYIVYIYIYIYECMYPPMSLTMKFLSPLMVIFPWNHPQKNPSPAASGSRAVASASKSWCCSCCTCSRSMRSNACMEGGISLGFHWDFTGISLWG